MYYRPKIFFPKKTYSMFREDIIIKKFFIYKQKGFYVDIGCYHPLDGNNTYLLYKKGWKGINVDLNELSIDLFNIARTKDENINTAISNNTKKVKIYFRKKINMLNTIDLKSAKKNFKNGFQTKSIQSMTLNSILTKSKFKNKKIDFLNLDVEGNELNVLKSFNFKKYRPRLICIEIHNHKKNPVYKFLVSKGYRVFWNNSFSYIFN